MAIEFGPRPETQPPAMDGPGGVGSRGDGGDGGSRGDAIDLSKESFPSDSREIASDYLEQNRGEAGEADQQPLGDHRGTLDEGAAASATAESGTPSDNLEVDSDDGGESDAATSTATVEPRGGS